MPVTYIHIKWPNKQLDQIYSPSSVIEEYFKVGEVLTVKKFLETANIALEEASERVRQKFGYACTSAQAESIRISIKCKEFDTTKSVQIVSIN